MNPPLPPGQWGPPEQLPERWIAALTDPATVPAGRVLRWTWNPLEEPRVQLGFVSGLGAVYAAATLVVLPLATWTSPNPTIGGVGLLVAALFGALAWRRPPRAVEPLQGITAMEDALLLYDGDRAMWLPRSAIADVRFERSPPSPIRLMLADGGNLSLDPHFCWPRPRHLPPGTRCMQLRHWLETGDVPAAEDVPRLF